jgi:hypothetical protein
MAVILTFGPHEDLIPNSAQRDDIRTVASFYSPRPAISELVRGGDKVALEGFTHLIPFAAGHKIIRQQKRDLTLIRMKPDLLYDQMIRAGCAEAPGELELDTLRCLNVRTALATDW